MSSGTTRSSASACRKTRRWRRERERDRLGDLRAQRAIERGEDLRGGQARGAPFVPGIEGHEEERGIRGRRAREEAEAVDGDHALNALELFEQALNLPRHLNRA